MAEYKLDQSEKKGLLAISSAIDSGFDCDDPVYGPSGEELVSILQETKVPGFSIEVNGKVHYISPDGKKYKVVASSFDKSTDEFVGDRAAEWEKTYTEILFVDESDNHFLTESERSKLEPLISALQQKFDDIYSKNWEETLRLKEEDEDISPDDVD